jgi:hypothetical protein
MEISDRAHRLARLEHQGASGDEDTVVGRLISHARERRAV